MTMELSLSFLKDGKARENPKLCWNRRLYLGVGAGQGAMNKIMPIMAQKTHRVAYLTGYQVWNATLFETALADALNEHVLDNFFIRKITRYQNKFALQFIDVQKLAIAVGGFIQ
ncbi:MAG: hypothetical protein K2Q32_09810, partial [Alphaproteobacteria bacterium]|nr:hypothetical protein [Alphaproteobacteria bacterium]